jgi:hypothetical protein
MNVMTSPRGTHDGQWTAETRRPRRSGAVYRRPTIRD